ncbi:MAG: hypothetical protein WD278_02355 [Pirellulales bacterium]
MSIRFVCPLGHRLKVPDHRAGKKGRCPRCHQRVIVPVSDPRPSGQAKRSWNAGDAATDQPPWSGRSKTKGPRKTSGKKLRTKSGRVKKPGGPSAGASPAESPPVARLAGIPAANAPTRDKAAKQPRPAHPASSRQRPPSTSLAPAVAGATPAGATTTAGRLAPPRWIGRARPELLAHGSRPGARRLETAYWLAAAFACLAVFGSAPALEHLNVATAPGWARLLLLASAVELIYVAWLASLPDWSTIRVGVVVWGLAAMLHTLWMVSMAFAPDSQSLGFPASGSSALAFSAANLVLASLASYFCGRISADWRLSERTAVAA